MRWTGAAALLSAVLAVWSPALVHGEEIGQADSLDVYETKHYPILQLPQTIFNYLVYPLGEFTIYAERSELPQRAYGWFTNADYTYGLFPQVQFGGETGTGLAASLFHANLFDRAKQLEAAFAFSGSDRQQGEFAYTDSSLLGRELYLEAEGEFLNSDHEGATVNGGVEDLSGGRCEVVRYQPLRRAGDGWLAVTCRAVVALQQGADVRGTCRFQPARLQPAVRTGWTAGRHQGVNGGGQHPWPGSARICRWSASARPSPGMTATSRHLRRASPIPSSTSFPAACCGRRVGSSTATGTSLFPRVEGSSSQNSTM